MLCLGRAVKHPGLKLSSVSDQQSVGSSPDLDTCVLEQDAWSFGLYIKEGKEPSNWVLEVEGKVTITPTQPPHVY